jgi:predicted transglutaminase-like protease
MTEDLYNTKRSLELEWQQEHLKAGKYTLNMGYIDKKIQEVIKEIIAKEFEEDTRLTKIDGAKAEVSIAT